MATVKIYTPDTMCPPGSPYEQIAQVRGSEYVFIAGQVAVDGSGNLVGDGNIEAQCERVFANIELALHAAGAGWQNVVEFTSYLVRREDIAPFRDYRTRVFPDMFANGAYPPSTLLIVSGLASPKYLLEVKATAAI
ncbi:RidA family protein [Undibacter mobilis]|uniref:RidA family protein n=1 Tax=Undibacter mobilis TaxID=2292256 RepID=A0A371B3F8_9BRAD|nr:RidA family protein [Undibacter mobilis]RDV02062.1 RidA family protein [Undibacter mobilis]